jgi:hypothetical protein
MISSKFSDYTTPPPKAPYQLNDIAVVDQFIWRGAQTKSSTINIGKMGIVVGYKNVPGAYSKYLLKFNDGNVDAYMPSYLKGPFISKEIAQTYINDPHKQIEPSDIKTKSGKVLSNEFETLPKVEQKLKEILTRDFHFVWFDKPELIQSNDSMCIRFKLAELSQEFPDLCLVRDHNKTTRKLKGSTYGSTSAKGYTLYMPDFDEMKENKALSLIDSCRTSIDNILKKYSTGYDNFGSEEYKQEFERTFISAIRLKEVSKRLPELDGMF